MTSRGEAGGPGAVDPARLMGRLASVVASELAPALDEMAARLYELFPVDVVAIQIRDEMDADEVTHGYCVGPGAAAQALAPLLTPDGLDPIGLGDAAVEAGEPVVWPRLVSAPAEIERLARLADEGGGPGALHRLMLDAGGLAVPIGTPHEPRLGAVTLLSLTRESPVDEGHVPALVALAPQIALTARNHQLAARTRRMRRTLEGVIASSRMGVLITDLRGRLSLANAAAAEMLDLDLGEVVGRPFAELVEERIKWRFVNPDDCGARILGAHADPAREARCDEELVDGRAIEHTSSPVRDHAGLLMGRVDLLTDVSTARGALAEARRLAAERAQLLEREERRAEEEMALAQAAHRMASALTPADIHEELRAQAHEMVAACEKSLVLAPDRPGVMVPAASAGFAGGTLDGAAFTGGDGIVGRAITARRPFICNDTLADPRVARAVTDPEGIRSFIHVPLVAGERVLGVVSACSTRPRAFGERDLRVLAELARHAASALQNAIQFEQDRHIAETLQQALIADELPRVEGLEMAAIYQAAAGSEVGGDFYSAWKLPDRRLAVLVGDVSGKGVEAAGQTAMVRYMAEALSAHVAEPADLVTELNDLIGPRLPDGGMVTLVVAYVDAARRRLRWCSAGHPPPVVLGAHGGWRALDRPDPPCGAFSGHRFEDHETPFVEGDTLVVYTDGIIEARRRGRELGEEGLHEVLRDVADEPPDRLVRSVYAAARDWCDGRLTDDVAVAAVKRVRR
ncbi:MAG: SpoIIE family protein phosphatase [Thermoleophilia bacterium]